MTTYLTAEECQSLDKIMKTSYNVSTEQLMECAGLALAKLVLNIHKKAPISHITCLIGKGNNGADALVAAKFLHNKGLSCHLILSENESKLNKIAKEHLKTAKACNIPIITNKKKMTETLSKTCLILDGLLGTGLKNNPTGMIATLIELANTTQTPIIAIDIPSGLNATTGDIYTPCIKAQCTISFACAKKAFKQKKTKKITGNIFIADIGIIPDVFYKLKKPPPQFQESIFLLKEG